MYNSVFIITEHINKFELYTGLFDSDFSITELKDKVAEVLGLSDISTEVLEHEIDGPNTIETYRKLSTEKSQIDGYYIKLINNMHSSFRDFESYLRFLSSLDDFDIQLILKQYISKLIAYKLLQPLTQLKIFRKFFLVEELTSKYLRSSNKSEHFVKANTIRSLVIRIGDYFLTKRKLPRWDVDNKKSLFHQVRRRVIVSREQN